MLKGSIRPVSKGTKQGECLCGRLPEDAVPDVGEDMKFESRVPHRGGHAPGGQLPAEMGPIGDNGAGQGGFTGCP